MGEQLGQTVDAGPTRLLTVHEVSDRIRTPVATLYAYRARRKGEGPPSFRIGTRIVYREDGLEQWLAEQEAATSVTKAVPRSTPRKQQPERPQTSDDASVPSPHMSVAEFAALVQMSVGQIYNRHAEGSLPVQPFKIGRKLLWDRAEVAAWLDELKAARGVLTPATR